MKVDYFPRSALKWRVFQASRLGGICQWSFLVPLIGGRWYISPQLAVYTTYIPLIYCLLGDYISPIPPIKGTRNSCWICDLFDAIYSNSQAEALKIFQQSPGSEAAGCQLEGCWSCWFWCLSKTPWRLAIFEPQNGIRWWWCSIFKAGEFQVLF